MWSCCRKHVTGNELWDLKNPFQAQSHFLLSEDQDLYPSSTFPQLQVCHHDPCHNDMRLISETVSKPSIKCSILWVIFFMVSFHRIEQWQSACFSSSSFLFFSPSSLVSMCMWVGRLSAGCLCVCECVEVCLPWYLHGAQKTDLRTHFSPSTLLRHGFFYCFCHDAYSKLSSPWDSGRFACLCLSYCSRSTKITDEYHCTLLLSWMLGTVFILLHDVALYAFTNVWSSCWSPWVCLLTPLRSEALGKYLLFLWWG